MLRTLQAEKSGFLSILFSQSDQPLQYWDKQVRNGRIKRIVDESDKKLQALEILGNNVHSTFVSSPPLEHQSLGVTLPVLVLIVKNLKRYFFYQVQILDDKNFRRRFRMTNIPGFNRRLPTVCTFPITLEEGWNELATNLADLTERVYGTHYVETIRVEIHANCRLREVFFCEKKDAMKIRISSRPNLKDADQAQNSDLISLTDPEMETTSFNLVELDNDNENKTGTSHVEEAIKRMKEYEELAKKVKNYTNSTTTSNTFSKSIVSKLQGEDEEKLKESKSKTKDTTKNSNASSHLSFGEVLKREMYFEKPKSIDKTSHSQKKL